MDDSNLAERQVEWNLSDRIARLFVSSTFRDCVGEREILQKRVVPKLQRWCRQLRPEPVGLCAVDLRWGITEEQVCDRGRRRKRLKWTSCAYYTSEPILAALQTNPPECSQSYWHRVWSGNGRIGKSVLVSCMTSLLIRKWSTGSAGKVNISEKV